MVKIRKPHIAFSFPQKPNVERRSAYHDSGDFKAGKFDQLRTVSHAFEQIVSLQKPLF